MPSNTISNRFYYVYVLQSMKDLNYYIGFTNDLRRRMEDHQVGKSFATAPRRPFKLIYYEACLSNADARRREKYFKDTSGRRYLAQRLREYRKTNNSKLS